MHGSRERERREAATASRPTADPVPDLELVGAHWESKGELGVGRVVATASRPTSRLIPELDSIGFHLACTALEHWIGGRRLDFIGGHLAGTAVEHGIGGRR